MYTASNNTGMLVASNTNVRLSPADGNHPQQVRLMNNGVASVSGIVINPLTPLTIESSTCNTNVESNQSCSFYVDTVSGISQSGVSQVSISYYDGKNNQSLKLNVVYLAVTPQAQLALTTYFDLLNTTVNQGVRYIPVQVTNTGNTTLYNLIFISPSYQNSQMQFGGVNNTCDLSSNGMTLQPKASCTLILNYQPNTVASNNVKIYPLANYYDQSGNNLTYSNGFLSIAYSSINSSTYIVAGALGALETSSNATSWISQTTLPFSDTTISANSITNNLGAYTIANSNGSIYSSRYGLFWNSVVSPGSIAITNIIFNNGTYYLAGGLSQKNISSSSNLTAWNTINTTASNITGLYMIGNLLISTLAQNISVLSQGIWYPQVISGNRTYNTALYDGANYFVLGNSGYVAYSSTGLSGWNILRINGNPNILSAAYGNNTYVATTNNGYIYSTTTPTNIAWNTTNPTMQSLNAIIYAKGVFVVVGNNGTILTSTNASSWNPQASGTTNSLLDIYFDGSQFWITGTNVILTSTDGINWYNPSIRSVVANSNAYISVGTNGGIFYSTNLSTWISESSPTPQNLNKIYCSSQSYCFVVGESGTLLTSNIGAITNNWNQINLASSVTLNDIVCGINSCIAVGDNGNIFISSDLRVWNNSVISSYSLKGITYYNGLYIAVGSNGAILTSANNGISWGAQSSGTTNQLNSIKCTNAGCIVVGNNGTILMSINGYLWNSQSFGINHLTSVTYFNGTYVATGLNNTIITSSNGGSSWSTQASAYLSTTNLYSVFSY